MQKVKFDFEAIKENIFVKQSANVPVGAPVDENGNVANDGRAHGIVIRAKKQVVAGRFVKNLTVMVAGYCDIIDAQEIWGNEYSAEAIAAMSDIIFCDDHKIGGGGGGWPSDLPKPSVGGYGYTEQGELEEIFTKDFVSELNQGIYGVQFENETGATISIGNSYVVNFDGEEFHCIGVSAGDLNGVGNTSLMPTGGDNTGEPFVAAFDEDFGMIITAEGGNHSITISAPSDTVHKIDEKYLPEAGGGVMVVTVGAGEGGITIDKEYSEIMQAVPNVCLYADGRLHPFDEVDRDDQIIFSKWRVAEWHLAGGEHIITKIEKTEIYVDSNDTVSFAKFTASIGE